MPDFRRAVVEAPGKINLLLDITGTAEDGYHTVDTVLQAIDLSDIVVVSKIDGDEIRVTCSNTSVPENEENIAYKAAMAFFKLTGVPKQGLSIHIDKTIPVQAGVAGGSADAAAVLLALNEILGGALSAAHLHDIGRKVGVDVPFCMAGGCQFAQGRGDILTPLPDLPPCYFVLSKPPRGVDTAQAYRVYDSKKRSVIHPDTAAMLSAIKTGNLDGVGKAMGNVFQQVEIIEEVEVLAGIYRLNKALGSVMTGSGSAVVGLYTDGVMAAECKDYISEIVRETFIVRPIAHGAKIIHIS
ncbi:MAG: 4-(cytidine 5'-diphospho)-2-C-methyl-D-erythritol kinase [Oscillospiraceae bacterium]|jgi:4-diphosphocytidyl-2-C-methyl-D-erythritol kinase|nr:4-(cytidine 5'-diphospho)-2-C-methyl-D-erythritol kinase [Oscillospiraceae bacterium]